ncbi:hypothetical protein LTR91_004084 [Friedmanniomyces endolithicus]|uniref:Uncharacterized protein n=1 Tax=Friedmanniomyces endolithicus TaxID=329885 RepID=A0AAN6QYW5_9PEZI|nr:hypothetical protein LTR38_002289 [Friedmanniomyces endolithicus]KAK0857561.1 hypothetical protein LTR03_000594 [Friedmanniomyces endolithicus]KAK0873044.1 hypothetical protein LTS02_000980 [Friedmanniomyces endolithicus]KAK1005073.1 hypothetical protein LTS01_003437 [Friedmanniomyces endolithicus]KAK1005228.1 hypothetical protein LTR91_004084 [Friedmanniomyces endolithicus]
MPPKKAAAASAKKSAAAPSQHASYSEQMLMAVMCRHDQGGYHQRESTISGANNLTSLVAICDHNKRVILPAEHYSNLPTM